MNLKLLNGLFLDNDGNLVNREYESIHLRQGDMDGACGPYSVAMALLALGKLNRDEITQPDKIDYRTRSGKLLRQIHNFEPLVLSGTSVDELCTMLSAYNLSKGRVLTDSAGKLIPTIKDSLDNNNPVILDVRSRKNEGLSHWTLAVGHSDEHLFLLDPGFELQSSNFWNATVTTKPSTTRFGYRYMNPLECFDIEIWNIIEVC